MILEIDVRSVGFEKRERRINLIAVRIKENEGKNRR